MGKLGAYCLYFEFKYDEALSLFSRLNDLMKDYYGDVCHPKIADSLNMLGLCYHLKGMDEAESLFLKSYEIE